MEIRAKKIAESDTCEVWDIGGEVYRVTNPETRDIHGLPQSRRWECSRANWDRFRSVHTWARDVKEPSANLPPLPPSVRMIHWIDENDGCGPRKLSSGIFCF